MATDGSFLYYATDKGVYKVAKTGGTPIVLSTIVDNVMCIAVTTNAIYWVNGGSQQLQGANGFIVKIAL
jgi:hypothetical protein